MCQTFFMDPISPPNAKSTKLVYLLKVLMWIQLSIGISKMVLGFYNPLSGFTGFSELFATLIIYMAYSQLSFCGCVVYIFFCLLNVVTILAIIGQRIQNDKPIFTEKAYENAFMIINMASILFYIFAVICSFYAYREFKALSVEMGGSYEGLGLLGPSNYGRAGTDINNRHYDTYGATAAENNSNMRNQRSQNQFAAFSGSGIAIGGN